MISLIDTMQPDFDRTVLDKHSDADLYELQAKTDKTLAAWQKQPQPFAAHEQLIVDELLELAETIRNTLNRRYGCND